MLKKIVFFVLLANFALADGGPAAVENVAPEKDKKEASKEAPKEAKKPAKKK